MHENGPWAQASRDHAEIATRYTCDYVHENGPWAQASRDIAEIAPRSRRDCAEMLGARAYMPCSAPDLATTFLIWQVYNQLTEQCFVDSEGTAEAGA